MTQSSDSKLAAPSNRLATLVAIFLFLNLGGFWYLGSRLVDTQAKIDHLEHVIDRWGMETADKFGGFGFTACLNRLSYWAPKLQIADLSDKVEVRKRVNRIVEAIADMGPDIYPLIEKAYLPGQSLSNDPTTDDEVRRWLLAAARGADPKRGAELQARTIRAREFPVSMRLRVMAADQMLEGDDEDKRKLGKLLHEILTTQNHTGARQGTSAVKLRAGGKQKFYSLVHRYAATGDPKLEETMLMILGRRDEDRMTVQEAIKQLGAMHSQRAAEPIQKLFQSPPWRTRDNAIFRNHCLDALASIMGSKMLAFLESADRVEKDQFVRKKIVELKKRFTGGGSGGGR